MNMAIHIEEVDHPLNLLSFSLLLYYTFFFFPATLHSSPFSIPSSPASQSHHFILLIIIGISRHSTSLHIPRPLQHLSFFAVLPSLPPPSLFITHPYAMVTIDRTITHAMTSSSMKKGPGKSLHKKSR